MHASSRTRQVVLKRSQTTTSPVAWSVECKPHPGVSAASNYPRGGAQNGGVRRWKMACRRYKSPSVVCWCPAEKSAQSAPVGVAAAHIACVLCRWHCKSSSPLSSGDVPDRWVPCRPPHTRVSMLPVDNGRRLTIWHRAAETRAEATVWWVILRDSCQGGRQLLIWVGPQPVIQSNQTSPGNQV